MTAGPVLHFVVPDGIDDPARPSGGNTYDRRLREVLSSGGWAVRSHPVAGDWPAVDDASLRALGDVLDVVHEGSLVLVDGLVASTVPEVLVPASERVRLGVLVHLPLGCRDDRDDIREPERAVLEASAAVVTVSDWSRRWLLATYGLDPERVHTARPGVDPADPAPGSVDGRNLLCVGAVTPAKGHDVLLAALARVADLPWQCLCVGSLTLDPDFVAELRRDVRRAGLEDRFVLAGPLTGSDLAERYADADALVLATRGETYGMVVAEALARALPVLASGVGGVPEALGVGPDGRCPGRLLPAGEVSAWAESLRDWLTDAELRRRLRDAARARRAGLTGWPETADRIARVLREVAA